MINNQKRKNKQIINCLTKKGETAAQGEAEVEDNELIK